MLRLKQTLLKRISLATLGAAALLAPAQAMAAGLDNIYAWAYQQITNLKITGIPTTTSTQPNTSAGSGLTTANPIRPGQLTNPFDAQESFTSSSQPSGIDLGLGNNAGFFSGTPVPNTTKGQVNDDYARGDATLSSSATSSIPFLNTQALESALYGGTGVNAAGVAESYLNSPASTLFQTSPGIYYKDEGNSNGEWILNTARFTLTSGNIIGFSYDYLNQLKVQQNSATPAGATETNLASSEVRFAIQINEVNLTTGITRPRFTSAPIQVNKSLGTIVPNINEILLDSGSISGSYTIPTNTTGLYELIVSGGARTDTRLVTQVPGPLPVLGTAAAFGWTRKLRKRIRRSTTTPAMAPL
jgi:hypothetical protein